MKKTTLQICGWMLLCCSFMANAAIVEFQVSLDGSQVGGTGGDPDGYGNATLFIDDQALTASWSFSVYNIALPITAAHIHAAPAGLDGPAVVNFSGQLTGSNLFDTDLANVLLNPTGYYINLHNSVYPNGAIRGQLGSPVPLPATWPLLLSGLGMLAWRTGRHA